MPPVTSEAVCVRHWDFSETSQTVSLFTRDLGILRGLAKGARRERGRFSGGLDLLTRGQVIALVKPGRDLATLTDWDLLETFRHLRVRLDVNRAAFYMAELVCRMIADAHPHPRSYDALVDALRQLAAPSALDAALLRFQWTLLDDCGYRPSLEAPSGASVLAFSPGAGGVVEATPGDAAWPVRRETIERLRRVGIASDEGSGGVAREARRADEERTDSQGPDGQRTTGERSSGDGLDAAPARGRSREGGGGEDDLPDPTEAVTTRRAARLLAAYLREILGFEPSTMAEVFGPIPSLRQR